MEVLLAYGRIWYAIKEVTLMYDSEYPQEVFAYQTSKS